MIFVGIDVAKAKHDCCIVDSDTVLRKGVFQIPNTREGFECLLSHIHSALGTQSISHVKIGLESTGHYSRNITNFLYARGFQVIVLNPLVTSAFRKAGTLRKTKTDKCDAFRTTLISLSFLSNPACSFLACPFLHILLFFFFLTFLLTSYS